MIALMALELVSIYIVQYPWQQHGSDQNIVLLVQNLVSETELTELWVLRKP